MSTLYLQQLAGGKWAISRSVNGKCIGLVERSYMDDEKDIGSILQALDLTVNQGNVDRYFPLNDRGRRCPTLELLELFYALGIDGVPDQNKIGV